MRRKVAAGNWKMNGTRASLAELRRIAADHPDCPTEIILCPPATLLIPASEMARGTSVAIGAQDCHALSAGAHTGDISAMQLADAGARHVILGHSERRSDHGETSILIRTKALAARDAGLTAILCVGETLAERDAGRTLDVITRQLGSSLPESARGTDTIIAYEPVWAIGTGRTPSLDQIAEVHAAMRAHLRQRLGPEAEMIRLLYGGSVKPANAAYIFAVDHVDGALVGGASLKAADFAQIIAALSDA